MYRASYNNGDGEVIFYDDTYPLNEYRVLDATVDLEDSSAATFDVTLPVTNIAYADIDKMKTEICVYMGNEEIFDGRVLTDNKDFYNSRQLHCEGGLAYLIDTSQPQMEYHDITLRQFVEAVISYHNKKVSEDRQFEVKYISNYLLENNSTDIMIEYRATQFESTLEVLNSLCTDYGGHLKYERVFENGKKVRKISILADQDFEANATQSINFGENLLDFAQGFDLTELCTVVVSTGQRETSPDVAVPGDDLIVFDSATGYPTNITKDAYNALPDDTKKSGYYLLTDDVCATIMYQNPGDISPTYLDVNRRMYKGRQVYHARPGVCMYNTKSGDDDQLNFGMPEENYFLSDPIKIEAGKTYFISYRVDKAKQYVMYMITRSNDLTSTQNILEYKMVQTSGQYGVEDSVKTQITMPEGANYIYVCGLGTDIPIQLQESKANLEKLDTYLTMAGAKGTKIVPSGSTLEECNRATYDAKQDSEKQDTSKWFYITDEDKLLHIERIYKDGIYLINPDMVDTYGWIEKKTSWDDVTDAEELLWYNFSYLFGGQWDQISIDLTAFDLKMLGVDGVMPYRLYQKAWVISPPHGLETTFPITSLSIPLLNPESTQFTLGYKSDISFTEASNSANTDILKEILAAPTFSETLESAKANAAAMIDMAISGVITINVTENGAEELLIHDGPNGDWHHATKMWRWNINGLAYGECSYDQQHNVVYDSAYHFAETNVAITADGSIVANFITAGEMLADRIRGGELILGNYNASGSGAVPGKLTVYNSDGSYLFKVGDESNSTVSARGISAQSTPFTYDNVTVRDIMQIDKGHLYLYMTEKTGSYQQEPEHSNAIANIFMSRDAQWSSAEGCALIFFAPNFHFKKDYGSTGTATTKFETNVSIVGNTSISGDITIKGHGAYSNSNGVSGVDHIFKFDQGICIGVENNSNVPYWTNGSNEINIGGTTLNKSDLDALLALIHPQQNPDQNGGA